jgi:Flp pilus assembly protein TadG
MPIMIDRLIGSLCRRRNDRNSGAVTVELALTAPLLVALAIGIADHGALMSAADTLVGATRAAVAVAKAKPSVTGSQLSAYLPSATPWNTAATASDPTAFCICVDNTSTTCPPAGWFTCPLPTDPNPCLTGHGSDTRVLRFLRVSASQTFTPLVGVTNLLYFGSFSSQSLSAAACLRLQ